jgi:hydroxylamine reductase (hybrid-cluster protein)
MMFRNQCEETVKGTGSTVWGVCGKEDDIAAYQDVPVGQSGLRPNTRVQADKARMVNA